MRPCERCGAEVKDEWPYAWCKECGDNGTCHHGNRPENCDACFTESDLAYDAGRLVVILLPNSQAQARASLPVATCSGTTSDTKP